MKSRVSRQLSGPKKGCSTVASSRAVGSARSTRSKRPARSCCRSAHQVSSGRGAVSRAAASRGAPGGCPSSRRTMAPPKRRPASTTWAITSLALHSPAAGESLKRAGDTALAAACSCSIATSTFSTISGGVSRAAWATRYPRIRFCSSFMASPRLEDELLRPLAGVDLGRIDVAGRVHGHVVHPVELSGRAAVAPEAAQDAAVLAQQHPHLVVLTVRGVEMRLRGVLREVEVPRRAVAARLRRHDELTHEGAVLAEDLDAVVRPVAHVDEAVAREPDAVHGIAEALDAGVAGRPAVGAPVALVASGLGVEHDHAMVAVAIGDEELTRGRIDHEVGGTVEVLRVLI